MSKKEFIQEQIKKIKSILKDNENVFSKEMKLLYENDLKHYNQVLKDLERLEKQDKILEILKPYFSGAIFPSAINFNFSEEDWKPIKEWLDNL